MLTSCIHLTDSTTATSRGIESTQLIEVSKKSAGGGTVATQVTFSDRLGSCGGMCSVTTRASQKAVASTTRAKPGVRGTCASGRIMCSSEPGQRTRSHCTPTNAQSVHRIGLLKGMLQLWLQTADPSRPRHAPRCRLLQSSGTPIAKMSGTTALSAASRTLGCGSIGICETFIRDGMS
mgnify:FL=1